MSPKINPERLVSMIEDLAKIGQKKDGSTCRDSQIVCASRIG